MTPKEALDTIKRSIQNLEYNDILDQEALLTISKALNERDIYYKALCDIESGKDVRMILERVLT